MLQKKKEEEDKEEVWYYLNSKIEKVHVPGGTRDNIFVNDSHADGRQTVTQNRCSRVVVDLGPVEAARLPSRRR